MDTSLMMIDITGACGTIIPECMGSPDNIIAKKVYKLVIQKISNFQLE